MYIYIYNVHICILNQSCDFLRGPNADNMKILYNLKASTSLEWLSQHILKMLLEDTCQDHRLLDTIFFCCAYDFSDAAF